MHDRHLLVERRLRRFLDERIRPAAYGARQPFTLRAHVTGEPISFDEVMLAMVDDRFTPFTVGDAWGTPWSTTWFHVTGATPAAWRSSTVEALIDLGFGDAPGFQAEGMIWGPQGPLRALNPRNHNVPLLTEARGGETFEFLIEAAANPWIGNPGFRPTPLGDPATLPSAPLYTLRAADLAIVHPGIVALVSDLEVLGGLIVELPHGARRAQITRAIERSLDALDLDDVASTAEAARVELGEVLARPAVPSAHRISAVGHAHIDTAWLWPLRETVRKCARTFSNVLDLMDRDPDLIFVCSQAQHHEWMRERYPTIFAGMQARASEGRFVPVGGMWVEADMNLPSGESLARQLLIGQRFFAEHYGATSTEIWIPDVFGYPASLPQLFALGGAQSFLTQKLSWNKQNRMPHHTFWWQGIDGTRMFTHFPPVDTYNVEMQPAELAHAERNYADHGGGSMSLAPFGYGDGGGGPTLEMLERARRMADLEGLPRLAFESPRAFFDAAKADYPDAPTWVGELYLEMHRGVYTSQAATKAGNRNCERLLGEVELWSTLAAARTGQAVPRDALARIWREVLTLQFHDIIPGSSIAWVHDEAEAAHQRLERELLQWRDLALTALSDGAAVVNPTPLERIEVIEIDDSHAGWSATPAVDTQQLSDGRRALWASAPAMGLRAITTAMDVDAPMAVRAERSTTGIVIDNGVIRVVIDADGLITSLVHLGTDREVIPDGRRGNVLELSPDHPVEYDAWDIEDYAAHRVVELTDAASVDLVDVGPLVARVRVARRFGSSSVEQHLVVRAGSARLDVITDIDWQENERVLKVAMPVDVHADTATCGIQFGHVARPRHATTSWDASKFEVCAHGWVDVSEPGFGVALLNVAKYGYDLQRDALRLTLLRAANFPDPDADRGRHRFTYALYPHVGDHRQGDVVGEAMRLDQPLHVHGGGAASASDTAPARSAVVSSDPAFVITAVKPAEDGSGDVIVRGYESNGGRVTTALSGELIERRSARVCDLLENDSDDQSPVRAAGAGPLTLSVRPFQIITLRLTGA